MSTFAQPEAFKPLPTEAQFELRPNILAMSPYSPGKPIDEVKRELGLSRVIKLASNENPLGPSPVAIAAVRQAAQEMHMYPDGSITALREAIAQHYGFDPVQVVVGNGSDELIHLLGLVFLGSTTDEVLVGNPSFVRYDAAAGVSNCQIVKVKLDELMTIDLEQMALQVTPRTKIVFIANPNNPTGTIVTKAAVERFLDSIPKRVLVVLDEAYVEFAQHAPEFANSLEFIRRYSNVVGMRTFSKAYGLAGIRVGFAVMPLEVADAIHRAREPFNVNALAQVAAIAALSDQDHVRKTVELNQQGLNLLERVFRAVGATPFKSYANFMMADLGRSGRTVFQRLLERGVITRPGDILGLPNCLRVSVGTAAEMAIFEAEFLEVMSQPAD